MFSTSWSATSVESAVLFSSTIELRCLKSLRVFFCDATFAASFSRSYFFYSCLAWFLFSNFWIASIFLNIMSLWEIMRGLFSVSGIFKRALLLITFFKVLLPVSIWLLFVKGFIYSPYSCYLPSHGLIGDVATKSSFELRPYIIALSSTNELFLSLFLTDPESCSCPYSALLCSDFYLTFAVFCFISLWKSLFSTDFGYKDDCSEADIPPF